MTAIVATVLILHGLAHLVGFAVPWGLVDREGVIHQTSLLGGRFKVSESTLRALGIVWLLLAAALVAVGVALALRRAWAPSAATTLVVASLLMCVTAWPATRFGIGVNVVLLAALLIGRTQGWI